MVARDASSLLAANEYLVCYDMPRMSGLWGVLVAPSIAAMPSKYPELAVVECLPSWVGEAELRGMRETPLWLDDDPPRGSPCGGGAPLTRASSARRPLRGRRILLGH